MKNILLLATALLFASTAAFATGNELAYKRIVELEALPAASVDADNDLIAVWDFSAKKVKKVPAAGVVNGNSEIVTATNVIDSTECGKTFYLNSATEFVSTLPAPSMGCRFNFVVQAAPSGASYTIVTNASANIIIGHVETADIDGAADGDVSTADDTITFVDGVAVVGDMVELRSNGTSWYYIGHSRTYNGITANPAS